MFNSQFPSDRMRIEHGSDPYSRSPENRKHNYQGRKSDNGQITNSAVDRMRIGDQHLSLQMSHDITHYKFSIDRLAQFTLNSPQRIDNSGNAVVAIAKHSDSVFNCAIAGCDEMLTEFALTEPCIVGHIHNEVRASQAKAPGQIGIGILVADQDAELRRSLI